MKVQTSIKNKVKGSPKQGQTWHSVRFRIIRLYSCSQAVRLNRLYTVYSSIVSLVTNAHPGGRALYLSASVNAPNDAFDGAKPASRPLGSRGASVCQTSVQLVRPREQH